MHLGLRRRNRLSVLAIVVGLLPSPLLAGGDDNGGWHSQHHGRPLPPATIAARQHFFGLDNVDAKTGEVRDDRVIFSWTGVSGFAASFKGHVVLMDQYIARDGGARVNGNPLGHWPSITYYGSTPEELAALKPELALIGHTHFDHTGDLPTVVRRNPGVQVVGTAEHCNDLRAKVTDAPVNCYSVFEAGAVLGTTRELPRSFLDGVQIIAVKHPHSSASPNPALDAPFPWTPAPCTVFQEYPPQATEPEAWNDPTGFGPVSGFIAIMYHFSVGHFGVAWEDTSGYIVGNCAVRGEIGCDRVPQAFASLPKTDVRLASIAVSGRSVMDVHNSLLKPKLFIPLHNDGCQYLARKEVEATIAAEPDSFRPEMWFFSDPSDYMRPFSFDPDAEAWR
jgi:hypothetical protein